MCVRSELRSWGYVVLIVGLAIVCAISAPNVWAQSTSTGTVAGTITDPSGAVVSGATVTLTDPATKTARNVSTNAAGRYIFVDIPPGSYEVTISKQGFSTSKTKATVSVGSAITLNMALQVGGGNVVVEVTSVGTELQTMNATVGNTVSPTAIENLPSIGRDVNTFIELQPGVAPDGSVGGAVVDENYFSLDGGNNTNDMDGGGSVYTSGVAANTIGDPTGGVAAQYTSYSKPSGVMPTPADSVEEFKVNTANQTADFNSSSGAEVKVVTKRGTNTFHGTAYEYYRDNNWSGNTYQNSYNAIVAQVNGNPPTGGLPSYHYNRYGFALGGPLIPKEVLGGKTYFFFNFEGFNYPQAETYVRNVPSANLRAGLLTDTTTGATYSLAANDPRGLGLNPIVGQIWNNFMPAPNSTCQAGTQCDGANVQGYQGTLSLPLKSKFAVARLDHDFGSKEHFMASYRYFNQQQQTDDQVDIGGAIKGDKVGQPTSLSGDPVEPWYLVAGLTSNISNNVTNDFHYSFLRNWWAWNRSGDLVQNCTLCTGMGGALEIESGQSRLQDLGPYNVNTQNTRTRFWDGKDHMFRDDLSILRGNHLFQIGGIYQHNFNWHQRTDNGGGINYQPVYELGNGSSGSQLASDFTLCSTASIMTSSAKCNSLMAAALGIVSIAQTAYTRSGTNLALNPPLTPAFDQSTIPYYNVYFSDTWHLKPTFTFTYGLGYALEMPPVESAGKQVEVVDASGQQLDTMAYLAQRQRAALQGQVYNPEVGFALVGNTAGGLKYPYQPFYGQFSPRFAAAWNPHFDPDSLSGKIFGSQDTVIRGGYSRQYGRLNGVDLVLVPLLGTGLIQPVQCIGGATGSGCGANHSADPTTAFRIGVDGLTAPIPAASPTLPQPDFPGYNAIAAGAGEGLDPHFRPNVIDSFDLTIQRQLSHRLSMELGYIGRRITHEYLPMNINAVPYMMTMGGQSFANAYKNVVMQYCGGVAGLGGGNCAANAGAVTSQPFFESALAGTGYCTGFATCTAAVVANEGGNFANALVWDMWSNLDAGVGCPGGTGTCTSVNGSSGGAFAFPRSMMNSPIPGTCNGSNTLGCQGQLTSGVGMNASVGSGNYNAAFVSLKMADWKGLTMQSNFTWSKALGEGAFVQATSEYTAEDVFNLKQMYGRQGYDRKYVYNMFMVYSPQVYVSQHGFLGHVLGGWTMASIFTAGSGTPIEVYTTTGDSEEFGSGDNNNFFSNQNAVPIGSYQSGHAYADPSQNAFCTSIGAGFGCSGQLPFNIFKNGPAEANNWRNPILGLDTRNGGAGGLSGLPYWNMDFSLKKVVHVAENVNLEFQGVFANVFNHNQWLDPVGNTGLFDGSSAPGGFGSLLGEAQPRQIEIGARVRF
ncbi:MAG TPA: carboxypeptidase-like regulatory domain-containing protein [Candidatus Sulfotelmatobacter sp.]|nr:carboxypeptidase-like regulatory domain-containing protein [Candidatus Sulfotelmatobacter sp.]HEV2469107.1 carboxypeptidase-like regulatory domain-containing protein [Candidatus Sulfotelmatobacter sp.]